MSENKVKVAMITGYLGAGKTTLLNHILSNTEGIRAAVIVNDIGEVNIDAEFIARSGAVTEVEDSLIPMTNGCICCSLSDDLANQLRDLANSGDFDYIIIEASGICEPMPIAFTIQQFCDDTEEGDAPMALDNVIAVVDCARMFDEFNGGKDLVDDEEEDDIVQLLIEQIEFCSTLILNKVDQVEPEQLAELKAVVRSLQKKAKVIEAVRGQVDLGDVLNTERFDFEEVMGSAGWMAAMEDEFGSGDSEAESKAETEAAGEHERHHDHDHHHDHQHDHDHERDHQHDHDHEHHHHEGEECDDPDCECHHHHHHHDGEECDDPDCECHDHEHGHEHGHHHHHHDGSCCCGHDHEDGHDHVAEFGITTFVYERRCPFTVDSLNEACEEWPESVIRCKGMVWLDDNPDMCCVFEQAGSRFYLSENGYWLAALDRREREEIIAEDPSVMDNWIEGIGDRRTKLVFIGKNMDQDAVVKLFDSKLV